jgi:hypothetical protein
MVQNHVGDNTMTYPGTQFKFIVHDEFILCDKEIHGKESSIITRQSCQRAPL